MSSSYRSPRFSRIPGIVHAYSNRRNGDMRMTAVKGSFLKDLRQTDQLLVWPEQVHGTSIYDLTGSEKGEMPNVDGLIYKQIDGRKPVLGVFGADCVPMLFADPVAKIIATAHAGWKGTLGNIVRSVVQAFIAKGSDVKNIQVSIGPHIGVCCYTVPPDRAKAFQTSLGNVPQLASIMNNEWHLDIGYANVLQLQSLGVQSRHIDNAHRCTSCEVSEFFSFRKDTKETFGEIMGVIAFTSH